jgi:hypothetical protein
MNRTRFGKKKILLNGRFGQVLAGSGRFAGAKDCGG